jgi:hypothetical protein
VRWNRLAPILAATLLAVPGFAAGLPLDDLEAHVGALTIGDWHPPSSGLSAPIALVGASVSVPIAALPAPWTVGIGLDLLGTWYQWDAVDGWAQLCDRVDGGSFLTLGVVASPRFGARWPLGAAVTMGGFASLDLLVRFPFAPFSTNTDLRTERLPALGYFLAGRFLYPGVGWWMTWQATKDVELVLSLRGLAPLYRAWDPEVTGFLHLFVLAGHLGMTIPLKLTTEPAASP